LPHEERPQRGVGEGAGECHDAGMNDAATMNQTSKHEYQGACPKSGTFRCMRIRGLELEREKHPPRLPAEGGGIPPPPASGSGSGFLVAQAGSLLERGFPIRQVFPSTRRPLFPPAWPTGSQPHGRLPACATEGGAAGRGAFPTGAQPLSLPSLSIMTISGRKRAMTMLPTMTARNTIMMGSRSEVMAVTALSTSSS